MPFNYKLPDLDNCCGCVTDLKTATAIIAVLAIVTSPSVSWAIVRHSYVIRVSCYMTTGHSRADVTEINLNNVITFGFGANAGLSSSCIGYKQNDTKLENASEALTNTLSKDSEFIDFVKYIGWVVLFADIFLVLCSVRLLIRMFKRPDRISAKLFMWAAVFSLILSFIYGSLYVVACVSLGGAFPMFEAVFSFVDVIVWVYFLIVVNSFRRLQNPGLPT